MIFSLSKFGCYCVCSKRTNIFTLVPLWPGYLPWTTQDHYWHIGFFLIAGAWVSIHLYHPFLWHLWIKRLKATFGISESLMGLCRRPPSTGCFHQYITLVQFDAMRYQCRWWRKNAKRSAYLPFPYAAASLFVEMKLSATADIWKQTMALVSTQLF